MAAISSQNAGHELLGVDDNMEISSDAGRPQEEDIDIDIEFERDNNTEDEYMLEDGMGDATAGPQRSTVIQSNDDVMLDSEDESPAITQDEVLRDASIDGDEDIQINDLAPVQDAPLQIIENPVSEIDNDQSPQASNQNANQNQDTFNDTHDFAFGEVSAPINDLNANEKPDSTSKTANPSVETNETAQMQANISLSPPTAETEDFDDASRESATQARDDYHSNDSSKLHQDVETEDQQEIPILAPMFQTDSSAHSLQSSSGHDIVGDGQDPHTVNEDSAKSSLHPAVIIYENTEIHLFPPTNQTDSNTFFLNDESLANQTIENLLLACRTVLGESLAAHDELELGIAVLGLTISEGSTHCANSTFADILLAYVQLCQNDGIDDPGPLYVTLTTQPNFSSRLESLRTSAAEGKGLSEIDFLHLEEELYESVNPTLTEIDQADDVTDGEDAIEHKDPTADGSVSRTSTKLISTQYNEAVDPINDTGEDLHTSNTLDDHPESADVLALEHDHVSQKLLDAGSVTNDNVTGADHDVTKNTNDTDHPEDDLFDFGDDEAPLAEGQTSSGSSTVQGEVTAATTEAANWQSFSVATEGPEILEENGEVEFEFLHEENESDEEIDAYNESPLPAQDNGLRISEDSKSHSEVPPVEDNLRKSKTVHDEAGEDDINFDDDFESEIGADDVEGDVEASTKNPSTDERHDVVEHIKDTQDAKHHEEWDEDADTLTFDEEEDEEEEENLETNTVDTLDQERTSVTNLNESGKPPHGKNAAIDDIFDYADDTNTISEETADDTKTDQPTSQHPTPKLSRKRSLSEQDDDLAADETPQSAKKYRSS